MASYTARLLRVDLTSAKISTESIPTEIVYGFIGGRGFGIRYLYDEVDPHADPLGPENKLLLSVGPLTGTSAQSASRWVATGKSPLTDTFARSVCGADFGAWLRFAGLDLIVIEGKSDKPVYLHIEGGRHELCDAAGLWGKDTAETQRLLRETHGDRVRVACIGPAGEKLVRYAGIVSERRIAARGGLGTVMGAKNLKAVSINAMRRSELHDPGRFGRLVKEQVKTYKTDLGCKEFALLGTTGSTDYFNRIGVFPVRNFRQGQLEGFEKLSGEQYSSIKQGDFGCYSCMVKCGKIHTVREGEYAGVTSAGPEYETIWAFSGPMACTNIGATVAADKICDDLGLDTISAGNAIGFAYELYEKGILSKADTDGLELRYGDHAAMIALLHKIAHREGIGDLLAEGIKRAGASIGKGAEAYAMHVKGLEIGGYEPRAAKAQGLSYATASMGANHSYGYSNQEIFGATLPRAVDRLSETGKGEIAVFNQDLRAMAETGVLCSFSLGWSWFTLETFGQMLVAATGITEFGDADYLNRVGERIYNLERAFNLREGFSREDDLLPRRMLTEPLERGPAAGQRIQSMGGLLDEYYQVRGWSPDGVPTVAKLRQLGLEAVIEDLKGPVEARSS